MLPGFFHDRKSLTGFHGTSRVLTDFYSERGADRSSPPSADENKNTDGILWKTAGVRFDSQNGRACSRQGNVIPRGGGLTAGNFE